jgi:GNAT superfamily N-acetyltransferase
VATHPDFRSRGIGYALMSAAVRHARMHGARHVALQVMEGNAPALRRYEKQSFRAVGAVTSYRRTSVRHQAAWRLVTAEAAPTIRAARWSDAAAVWDAARWNVPEELSFAEPFEPRLYQLGWRWSLRNFMNNQCEAWFIAEDNGRSLGALRLRINYEGAEHHLELMLTDGASEAHGAALLERALQHFETTLSKPILAMQSRPHEASHAALQSMGFKPQRTLLHMVLDL